MKRVTCYTLVSFILFFTIFYYRRKEVKMPKRKHGSKRLRNAMAISSGQPIHSDGPRAGQVPEAAHSGAVPVAQFTRVVSLEAPPCQVMVCSSASSTTSKDTSESVLPGASAPSTILAADGTAWQVANLVIVWHGLRKTTTQTAKASRSKCDNGLMEKIYRVISYAPCGGSTDPNMWTSPEAEENVKRYQQVWDRNKMPTAATAEESALLGTMPSDSMDDIELKNIQLQFPALRYLTRDDGSVREERVETDKGSLVVAVQGNRAKPAILTYHDLGLNYISSFQAFFNYIDMRVLLENFCVYHVNAPGQEEGAPTLPEDYVYPSMDELSEQLLFVLGHFGLKSVIGFGVGAGANILARFALAHSEKMNALCLINCVSTQAGWIEWGYQKLNVRHLRSQGMTQGVLDYLMWHHFGRGTEDRNHDLVQVYTNYFERRVNPTNLALFIDSYVRRTDLNLTRELDPTRRKDGMTLGVPVINITGSLSPHVDDTVTLNGRLDPTNSSWMKISDCGMVLEEQPGKVSEAFRLFLQGEGYVVRSPRKTLTPTTTEVAPLSPLKMADYRLASLEGLNHICSKKIDWPTATIHITENPISEAVVC